MNHKIFSKKRCCRTLIPILILLVSGLFYPLQVRSQTSVPSQLNFFIYPPNWNYPYEDIVGSCWLLSINGGEGSSLTGHLDVPSRYYGKDPSGDIMDLPVKVIWNLISDISSVHIPSSILIIGDNAFRGCTKLKSIVIPNTVKYIGSLAFRDCTSLSSVVISPENECTTAFSGCDIKKGAYPVGKREFVAEIEVPYPIDCIPDSAGLIYDSSSTAFYFAPWNREELDLPETVKTIGPKALAGCTKLKTLRVKSTTPPSVSDDTFDGAKIGSIEVPYGTKDVYINAPGWSDFAAIITEGVPDIPDIPVESISLNVSEVILKPNETTMLIATVAPENASDKTIGWESDNESVATVDGNGVVTAIGVGTASIKATCGSVYTTCNVTVEVVEEDKITLNISSAQLKVKETVKVVATVLPEASADKTIKWSSSDGSVATVDATGLVTGIDVGVATITASCGSAKAMCEIKVYGSLEVTADFTVDGIKYVIYAGSSEAKVDYNTTLNKVNIVIPDSVTYKGIDFPVTEINSSAFKDCKTISGSLKLGKNIRYIGGDAFSGCTGLTGSLEIPNSVTMIRSNAFYGCSGFDGALIIGESVANISESAFRGCSGFTSLTLGNSLKEIADYAFYLCSSLAGTLNIPDNVSFIGACAFQGTKFDYLVLPASSKRIQAQAFYCPLKVVECNAVVPPTAAGAFSGESYCKLYVPKESISDYKEASGWKNFYKISAIGEIAVERVTLNEENIELKVGNSFQLMATVYPDNANDKCVTWSSSDENVIKVDSDGKVTATGIGEAYVIANCNEVVAFCNITVIPADEINIELNETNIVLKETESFQLVATVVPEISESGLLKWASDNESVAIVDGNGLVTAVSAGTTVISVAYGGVSAICEVTVKPATITIIPFTYEGINYNIYKEEGTASVADNSNLVRKNLVIPDYIVYQNREYVVTEIEAEAFCKRDQRGYICDNTGLTGSLTIGNSVKKIGRYAFCHCNYLSGTLTIPNSVESIGDDAFNYCTGFTGSLTIPNSVTVLEYGAFNDCKGFDGSLTLSNSIEVIGYYAFSGCRGFTGSLVIPNSVKVIGTGAFDGCSGFRGTLTIPDSVIEIGGSAFSGCSGFTGDLNLPAALTYLGSYAFSGCSGFTGSLAIPNAVTEIGERVFYNCSGFTGTLTIPDAVTYIYSDAFYGCSGFEELHLHSQIVEYIMRNAFGYTQFKEIYCDAIVPLDIASDAFSDWDYKNSVLNVPVNGLKEYREAYGWRYFQNKKAIGELASGIILDKTEVSVFVDEIIRITANVEPDNAVDKSIEWESDNEAVATVSSDGTVTALSVGVANITATCGDVSATCVVTVKPVPASGLILDVDNMVLATGERKALTATIAPENTTDKTILWSSSDESVATVSEDGVVMGISFGNANITATCGDVSAICKVTVTETAGIVGLFGDENSDVEVYTIKGMKLDIHKAAELKTLTRGFYIINGKKVFVE